MASSNAANNTSIPTVADTATTADDPKQAKYKAQCDNYVTNGLTKNKTIQFLINKLDQMGCTPPEGFVRCTDCRYLKALGAFHLLSETKVQDDVLAGGQPNIATQLQQGSKNAPLVPCNSYFQDTLKKIGLSAKNDDAAQDALLETLNKSPAADDATTTKKPEIFLCQQHLSSEDQAHRTMIHELVYAVDTCRSKMDPQRNCIHLACTEIRAENLSSECTFFNELFRVGPHNLRKHGQDCVRRRALLSVNSHPRCRERAEEFVDAAMGRCYKDIFPFERHPNEQN